MEGFKLDISTLLSQHVHHHLEIVWITDVSSHDGEIMPVQQQLSQQLQQKHDKPSKLNN